MGTQTSSAHRNRAAGVRELIPEASLPRLLSIGVAPENNEKAANPHNINSSKRLKVAVFSTLNFDATKFSGGHFTLSDPDPPVQRFAQTDSTSVRDNNRDGLLDLIIDFGPARNVAKKGAISGETVRVVVIGTAGNNSFECSDNIKVLGKYPRPRK